MADEPLPNKPKRVRKPRRNFQKELALIQTYCEIKIDVLKQINGAVDPRIAGNIEALEGVLAKIGAQ